ncbi:response regulator transcription factor [Tessaracoccus sp. MC1865]|uniref:response regulator transcription factor n=1 Tax=Tessaracoccus sp. MC1865 TaxID=2760310 RepID=UPI001601D929|nr:response regulator transcription factor [Tessaracoccus sp. MC1865]MBB1484534.1 response regulator transcription factor [Tessaracoccus sp. MC1865]QTO38368.1 response regulator transcription factor [Tessaracoccus sp. MC1865]
MNEIPARITVAIVNDYPVVVEGVAQLLAHDTRLQLVELDTMTHPRQAVDIVLFDAFGQLHLEDDIRQLLANPKYGRVVVYTWNIRPEQVAQALEIGVHGYVSKVADGNTLCDALVRVHGGERVIEPKPVPHEIESGDWPGRRHGLSAREAEVIAMITQGITNDEIAKASYLSINSVKSYIRSAYRKMGVERRSQAVLWGVENGMLPRRQRREL